MLLLLLLPLLLAAGADAYSTADVPRPKFSFEPGVIHVEIAKNARDMRLAAIHLTVGTPVHGTRPGKFNQDLPLDGNVFRTQINYQWSPGDVIYYWVYVIVDGLGYQRLEQSHTISKSNSVHSLPPQKTPTSSKQKGLTTAQQERGGGGFRVPDPVFHLAPYTITVTIPALPGVSLAAIHLSINEPVHGTRPGSHNKDLDRAGNVFAGVINAPWTRGDTIYYWVYVVHEGLGKQKLEQRYVIGSDSSGQPAVTPAPAQPTDSPRVTSLTLHLPANCGHREIDRYLISIGELFVPAGLRVSGGTQAPIGDYPWQAQIKVYTSGIYKHHCGGVVISERHILTAAHCLTTSSSRLQIIVGQNDQRTGNDPGQQTFGVRNFVKHSGFTNDQQVNYRNDIAIILLDLRGPHGIVFGDYVQPLCLPAADQMIAKHTGCLVSGWGRTNASNFPAVLHGVVLPYVSMEYCSSPEVWGDRFDGDTQLCAGDVTGGLDSCEGDSGGPLACRDSAGKWTATGLVSWGADVCGQMRYVGVYTRVASFLGWMEVALDFLHARG